MLYDYSITFSMEVEHIWLAKPSAITIIYLIQRYLPFIDSVALEIYILFSTWPNGPSQRYCAVTFPLRAALFQVGFAFSEVILTLRVYAVWSRNKRLSILLPLFYAICFLPSFVILGVFLKTLRYAAPIRPDVGCIVSEGSALLFLCWILLAVYDLGILILMLTQGVRTYRLGGNLGLYNVVYRDGIIYYIYLFALSSINVVVVLTSSRDLASLLASTARVVHALLTSRVVLHIRQQAGKRQSKSLTPSWTLGEPQFVAEPEWTWAVHTNQSTPGSSGPLP
ncbi:hypothetical protein C8J56DRAFT_29663 [Mycena floridula]|nr:hypothetical protein C8J56DRAFT_29663 [Mycena floridula]